MKHAKNLFGLLGLAALLALAGCQKEQYVHVGPNWASLNELETGDKSFDVTVLGRNEFQLGDALSFKVDSESSGRLWVVQVDPEDEISLLYPNELARNNQINAGQTLSFPPEGASWEIEASEPTGKSVVAFIVTTSDTDFAPYLRDQDSLTKAVLAVESEQQWGMSKHVIEVRK